MTELFADITRNERKVRTGLWIRRGFMTLFVVIPVLGLLDLFGQRTTTTAAAGAGATLTVDAPKRVRGGLLFQTRLDIAARARIGQPRIVLDRGALEGIQVSSIEPAAASESSRDGRLVLAYGAIAPGGRVTIWMQFQVDPTAVGSHGYGIELDDGTALVARARRDLEILP